jgi:hypothetical protein
VAPTSSHDTRLLEPALSAADRLGVVSGIETLMLDGAYDNARARCCVRAVGVAEIDCARKRKFGTVAAPRRVPLGGRLADRGHQLVAVELRVIATQHRLSPHPSQRPDCQAVALLLTV